MAGSHDYPDPSNRIVGYAIDSRMKASLAVSALRNAVTRRDPVGTPSLLPVLGVKIEGC